MGATGVIGTLGCGMNEQLLGSITTRLMKCDGHQFVGVGLTDVGNLYVPILLDHHSPLSQWLSDSNRELTMERPTAHTPINMATAKFK